MKHWKYFKYLMRHKWFVFVAGLRTKAPIWRLIIHDWSKFMPCEWFPYVEYFYGEKARLQKEEWDDSRYWPLAQKYYDVCSDTKLEEAEKLRAALKAIRDVACGEDQVSDDDTEALAWVYQRATTALGTKI